LLNGLQAPVDCAGNRRRIGDFPEGLLDCALIGRQRCIRFGAGRVEISAPAVEVEDRQVDRQGKGPAARAITIEQVVDGPAGDADTTGQ
jgi:hypothetical protein